jgi:GMP synthase (glutamine-hydrolysing)
MHDKILIVDFGSQYTQLIGRRVRELHVYSEIVPYNNLPELDDTIKGVILSGSPWSVTNPDAPFFDAQQVLGKRPILGVCFGAQLIARQLGGDVSAAEKREYGRARLAEIDREDPLFSRVPDNSQVWMSHGDTIGNLPPNFTSIAGTQSITNAAYKPVNGQIDQPMYGLQFHPEVTHSTDGRAILKSFVFDICDCQPSWTPASFIQATIQDLKVTIGDEQVVLGLSGGVDSSVTAGLLHRAIGDNLHCIFVDNGLLRKGEFDEVLHSYRDMGLNITPVDATDRFLDELHGVSDPEQKRKIIGRVFIETFHKEAQRIENVAWLAQGTIYPDVIESISVYGPSATIKSHHNVGGLPDKLNLKVVEPLQSLFKDEVRKVGHELNIPDAILKRHPFPGPGLAIRILGAVTREKLATLKEADRIFIDNLIQYGLYDQVWQAGTILLPVQSVGVMGDERTYENVASLRAVTSVDGMTADWSQLPCDFLAETSTQIINNVKGINRVVYDISSKPPSTIEWE